MGVMPALTGLEVGDPPRAWRAAGFMLDEDDVARIGSVGVHCTGNMNARGVRRWSFNALHPPDAQIDGLLTFPNRHAVVPAVHPNGALALDHVVVFTENPARTTAAFESHDLQARRVRDAGDGVTQTFFRAGEVIIELLGPMVVSQPRIWGLAVTVGDIDAAVALLGENCGEVKDAVQPGRRIATVRHEALGMSVPLAFMSE